MRAIEDDQKRYKARPYSVSLSRGAALLLMALAVAVATGCGDSASGATAHAEITRCYATPEGAPAADVALSASSLPTADPSYTVNVIFESADSSGSPSETAGATLTLLGASEAHESVSLLGADPLAGETGDVCDLQR